MTKEVQSFINYQFVATDVSMPGHRSGEEGDWGDWESLEIISSIMIGRTHKHFNLNKCEISNYSFKPKNKFIEENHFKILHL